MKKESNMKIHNLAVDGGASANNYLMQFQASILNCQITRPKVLETTAKGAAYLAGLKTGVWNSLDELKKLYSVERIFTSQFDKLTREKKYNGWLKAVNATRYFKVEEGE